MPNHAGYPIVLTADRTLMANYRLLFDGMLAASQTSTFPPALLQGLLMPRAPMDNGQSRYAPLGLRRIEAALIEGGFKRDDIAVVDEYSLRSAIGPDTRAVGVASGEPAGLGMNSSTMTGVAGGRIYPQILFERLMNEVKACIASSASPARVILGGPGAWQLVSDEKTRRELGIDCVITGYAEGNADKVFRSAVNGDDLHPVIVGKPVSADQIPRIVGASTMGVVEISRGCGLGCSFCTISKTPMQHLHVSGILADVETNIRSGNSNIAILSEDFFRYGANGTKVNPAALISLLQSLRELSALRLIQVDHVSVNSISQYSDKELRMVRQLIVGNNRHRYPWVNVGVETASGKLLAVNGGRPKMGSHNIIDWGELCAQQVRRLCVAGFLPMASLVIGLPGESPEDIEQTLAWVESLRNEHITVFPVLYAPVDGSVPADARNLTRLHWRLIRTCYDLNFKWTPRMYWDNCTGAGVPLSRRIILQVLGRGQVLQWKTLFALHNQRASK